MNGNLLVFSFCDVCSVVSRSISWARCFACGYSEVIYSPFFEKLAHFLAFVVKVGVVTTDAPQSKKLRG